ncbi:Haloacid dehalogenase-like protein [Naganishia onofrii]|uniref:Haloacid dehalogenase-like protein n=1 Tax=Naganishia onofrii TaxID=1851511 RepID=A0ACC2XTB8_9TREE|nr:Haloacid dehalogenase-like protein [Naganishia onofrii]
MSVFAKEAFQMSAMPSPVESRRASPGPHGAVTPAMEPSETPHIAEIDVESVLFDMDGTLINSSPAVVVAWRLFAETYPLDLDDILHSAHGMRTIDVLRKWCKIEDPKLLESEVIRFESAILAAAEAAAASSGNGIEVLPGVRKLLDDLSSEKDKRAGEEKWAICTSSTYFYAGKAIPIAGLTTPKIFVTAESVTKGKPAPDPYLMGARGCNASPFESLVVEDAPTGIKAGKAAGCRVLATCTSHTAEQLEKEKPDFLVEDLSHVTAKWNDETKTFRLIIEQPVGRRTPVATPDATPVITPAMSRASSFASQMSRSEYFKPSDDLTGADSVFGSPVASRAGSPGPEDESGNSSSLSRKVSYKGVPGGVSLDQFKRALAGSTDKRRPSLAAYTEATEQPQQ